MRIAFVVFLALMSSCTRKPDQVAVSGPSECRDFTPEKLALLSEQADLQSIRKLRDLYMACDVGKRFTNKAYDSASRAVALGNEEDIRVFNGLHEAMYPPDRNDN